VFEQNLQ